MSVTGTLVTASSHYAVQCVLSACVCVKHYQDFAVIFFPSVFVHNLWRLKYIKHFVDMENSR